MLGSQANCTHGSPGLWHRLCCSPFEGSGSVPPPHLRRKGKGQDMAMQPSHEAIVLPVAPEESAQAAGLRYVSDTQPGIRRQRAGRGFCYRDIDGRPIRNSAVLRRIKALAIPPAWTDVWICPRPDGHVQARGRDDRGRKQYRYHPRWRAVRDTTKYDRMIAFGEALPQLRARLEQDMALPGLPCEKVLATVVRL